MVFELIIIAVVVLIGVLGVQNFRNRKTEPKTQVIEVNATSEEKPTMIEKASGWMGSQVSSISNKLSWKKNETLPAQFKAWVTDSKEADKGLKTWLNTLSDDGLEALTEQLIAFCSSLRLELSWLVHNGIEKDPDLKKVVSEVVLSYCNACWKAAEAEDEIQVFKTYISLVENPTSKANLALSKQLFSELVNQNIIANPPAELFVGAEKDRQAHMLETVQKVANEDRKTFNQVIRKIIENEQNVVEEEAVKEPSAPQAVPTSA